MLLSLKNSADYKEARDFIAAIRENPQDDAPRLVFADWLDDREGIEGCAQWAELIRLQCSPAATAPADYFREGGSSEEYARTHRRIAELMPQVAEMSGLEKEKRSDRGFFAQKRDFSRIDAHAFRAFIDPHQDWFGALNLSFYCMTGLNIETLAKCDNFPYITALSLKVEGTVSDAILALPQCRNFPNLTALDLSTLVLTPLDIQALARCDSFPNLTALNLSWNRLNAAGIQALAQCRNFPNLTALDLSWNLLNAAGIQALARCDNFPNLTALNLSRSELHDHAVQTLAQCRNFPNLTALNLSWSQLDGGDIQTLAQCRNFPHLIALNVSGVRLNADAITALAQCTNFPNLSELNLWGSRLREDDLLPLIRAIAEGILPDETKGETLPSLQRVITGDQFIEHLFADAFAARQRRLHPPQAAVTAEALQAQTPDNEIT